MMQLFRDGEVKVMVATDLAARGLDIKSINLVSILMSQKRINYIHR